MNKIFCLQFCNNKLARNKNALFLVKCMTDNILKYIFIF